MWLCERKAYHGISIPKNIFCQCGYANARRTTGHSSLKNHFVNVVMRMQGVPRDIMSIKHVMFVYFELLQRTPQRA